MKRKIFIDCGAWKGTSISFFRENHPDAKDFEIYAFECHPKAQDDLRSVSNIKVIEKAVWICGGELPFYLSLVQKDVFQEGSTLIRQKITAWINRKEPVAVEGIDFSQWIKNELSPDDYIIVKMNIEGAEYAVLDKMIQDKTLNYIDKLYVQWHWHKINYNEAEHQAIVDRISSAGITLHGWELYHDGSGNFSDKWKAEFLKTLAGEDLHVN